MSHWLSQVIAKDEKFSRANRNVDNTVLTCLDSWKLGLDQDVDVMVAKSCADMIYAILQNLLIFPTNKIQYSNPITKIYCTPSIKFQRWDGKNLFSAISAFSKSIFLVEEAEQVREVGKESSLYNVFCVLFSFHTVRVFL